MSRTVVAIRLAFAALIAVMLVVSAVACSVGGAEKRRRVVTVAIPPQQWMLRQIAGDRFEVRCMLSAGADPESFEPSVGQLAALERSEAYFTLGGLPFEEASAERLRGSFPHLRIVDATEGVHFIADGCHGHDHGVTGHDDFDPHVWTSLRNARVMAANMHRVMVALDPGGKAEYDANFRRLDRRLSAADDSIAALLAPCAGRTFMTWHPSMGYFAADYGLRQMSVQQEGREVTPLQLAQAVDEARAVRPVIIFSDMAAQDNGAGMLGADLGIPHQPLRLMQPDFVSELLLAARTIRDNQSL